MKFTIVFCLLFVLNSKKEFKPQFWLPKNLIQNNGYSNIKGSVCEAENKDQCKNLPSPNEDDICCYSQSFFDDEISEEGCEMIPKALEKIGELYKTKEYKAYYREQQGYKIYAKNKTKFPYNKTETIISCKNGESRFVFENKYFDEEITTLKDENHCLNINYQKENDIDLDVGKCEDYLILDTSKKDGIDCGYLVYNINLESKRKVNFKTCELFNLNILSKLAKLDKSLLFGENYAKRVIDKMNIKENIESFTGEYYNLEGKKIKYDSKTDKIIVEGSGYMINISKYLFLLILILF